jgi:hypothetical protein
MAVVMQMRWDGVAPEQYNQTRDLVEWETETPEGAIFHVAWFDGGGLNVIDVWESPEQFQRFVDERLTPATTRVGIQGEPNVKFSDAHRIFDAAHGTARS